MNNLDDQLLIHELAERAGVSVRTIRYYIAEGLLPAPTTRGRYAYYSQEYLDLIELIRRLKEAYLPLREIRALVLNLPAEKVKQVLEQNAGLSQEDLLRAVRDVAQEYQEDSDQPSQSFGQPEDSAATYAGRILEESPRYSLPSPAVSKQKLDLGRINSPKREDPFDEYHPTLGQESPREVLVARNELPVIVEEESTWRRIELAPGVELHVQEAEYQKLQERIRKLIRLAREILRT
jgi:DNA-binding transcriptional MerR regulator